MTIACKMIQCPYYDTRGFCAKPTVVSIDENGMCAVIWKRGQRRQLVYPFTDDMYLKKPIIIEDAAMQVDNPAETSKEEGDESRSEDPQNGDPA